MSSAKNEPIPSPDPALLTRGELALRALQLRKRAAEFEAVAAELEAAVVLARNGDASQLDSWMQEHGRFHRELLEDRLSSAATPTIAKGKTSSSETRLDPTQEVTAAPIPHTLENRPTETSPWDTMLAAVVARTGRTVENQATSDVKLSGRTARTSDRPKQASGDNSTPRNRTTSASSNMSVSHGATTVKVPRNVLQTVAQQNKEKPKNRIHLAWLGSSWGSSLIVHVLLAVVFAIVTVKLADEKVLSIVSAPVEASEALMETPMEFDPELPEELNESLPVEATSSLNEMAAVDISSSLPESMVGDLLAGDQAQSSASALQAISLGGAAARVANVQFFGVQAEGNTFCYVVDSSGSMKRDGAFEAAKAELVRSLVSLKPTQRFYIFFFSDQVDSLSLDGKNPEKFPVYATPENLEKAGRWIQSVMIRGGRPPNDALSMAIEMEPDAVFLLFDGDTKVDVPAYLRKANRVYDIVAGETVRVPIHTIGFYTQEFEPLMKKIAEENKGTYRFVPNPRKRTN